MADRNDRFTPETDGDWSWSQRNSDGYSYPADAHAPARNIPVTPRRGGRHRMRDGTLHDFKWPLLLAAPTVAVIFGAAGVGMIADPGAAAQESDASTVASALPLPLPLDSGSGRITAPAPAPASPYRDSGMWRIGIDIPAGTYHVALTAEAGGYWARCADAECDWSAGMLDNGFVLPGSPPFTLIVRPTDYALITHGLELAPQ